MSDAVTLTLRSPLDRYLEVDCITPDRLSTLGTAEIAALPVSLGARAARLGDFFDVRGGRSPLVRVLGSVVRLDALGTGMSTGELVIDGDAGAGVGAGMLGGRIVVHGSVGDDAGAGMSGGSLRIAGDAGNRTGAAAPGASRGMTGGEIIVGGSVGTDTGTRVRRGLIAVAGAAEERTGRAMIAGSVIVLGRISGRVGTLNKRGTIVAAGGLAVPPTYRYACTFRPPHLRLTLTYLRRTYDFPLPEALITGRYRRYCGDAGEPGKGEILEWVDE